MPLTDVQIKALKPQEKRYLKPDGEGLNLAVSPKGRKSWVFRYRFNDKADMLTLGQYGARSGQLTIKKARMAKDNAKLLIERGIDPKPYKTELLTSDVIEAVDQKKKAERVLKVQKITFEDLYDEYCRFKTMSFGGRKPAWEYGTLKKHNERFQKYVLPMLSDRIVSDLTEDDLELCLIVVQEHGALVSRNKIRTVFNGMFDYAKGKKYITRNIAKYISDSLFVKHQETHYKHVTTELELKGVVRAIDKMSASYEVKQCIKLGMLIFARPSEVSQLKWAHVDFDEGVISKPASEMKKDRDHVIPLSRQAKSLLEDIWPLTGHTEFVFYSPYGTGKPVSTNSLSNSLRRNGIDQIHPHGFRHTASTILNEMGFDQDAIELQLSHVIGGVRGVYNKAQKLSERSHMMQVWSDYIEKLI
jgi:integrase